MPVSSALSIQKRLEMLAAIAENEDVKMTQRLRALEEIGRLEARLAQGAAKASEVPEGELAPDPMADLDEMEAARQRRTRRRAASA